MHKQVATLTGDLETVLTTLTRPLDADWVEVRFDSLWPEPPAADDATDAYVRISEAANAAGTRILATIRPTRQGGEFDGPEQIRLGLLAAAAHAGFAIDLEADNATLWKLQDAMRNAHSATDIIISDHSLPAPPSREDGMIHLQKLQDGGGDLEKLAFPVGSFLDTMRALELAHAHSKRGGNPCIAPLGASSMVRALLALAGNRATYGHAPGNPPAVPGQPALAEIQRHWHHWSIRDDDLETPPPAWLAVIGEDVAHSLSPRIHNEALREAGHEERFGALDVPDSIGAIRLLGTVASRIGLHGASVTNPLKRHALAASQADEVATEVGAANCLRFAREATYATNTDVLAFERLYKETPDPASVLILGSGGAARAGIVGARRAGITDIRFASRDAERAKEVADDLHATWVPWSDLPGARADIFVQATSALIEPPAGLAHAKGAIELIYGMESTPFELAARRADIPTIDGSRFLVEQAMDAFTHWFGHEPKRAAMEAAL